jgi:putative transposase
MIAPGSVLSVTRQAKLLGISRSSVYYRPKPASQEEIDLLKRLDELFTENPMYGSRRLQVMLKREGILVGRHRIRRLMKKLGLWAVGPKPDTSKPHPEHKVYPLSCCAASSSTGRTRSGPTDITYIRMRHGFLYLCAIMDWATRKVLSMASVEHADQRLLHGGAQGGDRALRPAGNLQHRPGQPIHQRRIHRRAQGAWHPDQHGWPGTLSRKQAQRSFATIGERAKHLRRTAVVDHQARMGLSASVRHGHRAAKEPCRMLRLV